LIQVIGIVLVTLNCSSREKYRLSGCSGEKIFDQMKDCRT